MKFRVVLGMIIPIFYIGMGTFVIIEKTFMIKLKPEYAYSLGAILILYGLFRLYRAYTGINDLKTK